MKGAGFCSLYREIHYYEIHYNEIWVYFAFVYYSQQSFVLEAKRGWDEMVIRRLFPIDIYSYDIYSMNIYS